MEHQCHCGMAFDDEIALKRHIKVVHRNNYWACSGEWVWDDRTESHCPQVCTDKFNLWKHFRTQHQDWYLHYCPVDSCNWGTNERTALPQHIQNIHKWKPVADVASQQIKCPKCNKLFSEKNKMRAHLLICGNQDKPFQCSECDEAFRCTVIKVPHPKKGGGSIFTVTKLPSSLEPKGQRPLSLPHSP